MSTGADRKKRTLPRDATQLLDDAMLDMLLVVCARYDVRPGHVLHGKCRTRPVSRAREDLIGAMRAFLWQDDKSAPKRIIRHHEKPDALWYPISYPLIAECLDLDHSGVHCAHRRYLARVKYEREQALTTEPEAATISQVHGEPEAASIEQSLDAVSERADDDTCKTKPR
jgi:hypothetical protein